jgi:hypothetical protein
MLPERVFGILKKLEDAVGPVVVSISEENGAVLAHVRAVSSLVL